MNALGHDYNDYGQDQLDILIRYNEMLNEAEEQPTWRGGVGVQVSEFNWVYIHPEHVDALTDELDESMA